MFTMNFIRFPFDGPACLEYSVVPTGQRLMIHLAPGQASGQRTDQVSGSHVQVYSMTNQGTMPISNPPTPYPPIGGVTPGQNWQFPQGAPGPFPLASATIQVVLNQVATGVAFDNSGTATPTDLAYLSSTPGPCPEIPHD